MSNDNILRTEKKVIDNDSVECTIFPGLHGLRLKGRLLKIVGPAVGKAFSGIKTGTGKSVMDTDINLEVVGQAIEGLTESLDNENTINLILDLLTQTRINGESITKNTINLKFAGEYSKLYKVLLFVIEANRFFGKWSIGKLFERIENPTIPITPTESTKKSIND